MQIRRDGADCTLSKAAIQGPIRVSVPGSKSITNRALLIAALAEGTSVIRGILFSDDSRHFLQALLDLGFPVTVDEPGRNAVITGFGGRIPKHSASINVGSAGTAARFLTAFLALTEGDYLIDSSDQMKKRPMQELLEALEVLGANFTFPEEKWHFPFNVTNGMSASAGSRPSRVTVDVDKSSQFLSALLISSVLFDHDFTIEVIGSHGMAYVEMTIRMMEQFGVTVCRRSEREYFIPASSAYHSKVYDVEPDLSAACYFYAMSPLLGVPAQVAGVHSGSLQGDEQFLSVLTDMGCTADEQQDGILMLPPKDHKPAGGSWNLSSFSDQALTLAAIAPFCNSPVTIRGIGHIRYQECDRIHAILSNLEAIGIRAEEADGDITVYPGQPKAGQIHTFDDHRVAMAFSLPGLVTGDMKILNYRCCRKTFENYFDVLEQL